MHPSHEGLAALPYFDEFDLSTVDVLLISQYVFAFAFVFHNNHYVGVTVTRTQVLTMLRTLMNRAFHLIPFVVCMLSVHPARRRNALEAQDHSSISVFLHMSLQTESLYIRKSIASQLSLPSLNILCYIVM